MSTPHDMPQVPPRDLYPTSDIRFALLELGKLSTKTDRLIADVERLGAQLADTDRSLDRLRTRISTILICLSVLLPMFGGVLWWAIGERVSYVMKEADLGAGRPAHTPGSITPAR